MRKLKILFLNNVPWVGGKSGSENFHGDATYIALPDGTDILIDVATEVSGPNIAKKLIDMGVKKIDYFIASHLHSDHINGFEALAEAIPVSNIIFSGYGKDSISASPVLLDTAEKLNIPVQEMRQGESISFNDVKFDVFSPAKNAPEAKPEADKSYQSELLNNYSLVFRLSYGKFSALFTGDIHLNIEESLVEQYGDALKSTILKIPHHGNDTSMGKTLLDCVNPKLGVSLGRTCNGIIWRKYCAADIPLYATYTDGDIIAETDGTVLTVTCKKGINEFIL
ncbi:MAG: MBL fold metallo-hydrolase [Clostridia bacterium]|nr:MBL fold metallo-hydrolase [Clostridia bacterium]